MAFPAGFRIGIYELGPPIGAGGMGEVYRARDTRLGRDVAIKILPTAFASDADRVMRFEREARALAALNHPNIAQVFGVEDVPEDAGRSETRALVMELVDGDTLAERIAAGPLTISEVIAVSTQIAEALETAHEHGIIHRDLKPANVKLREDGAIKVLDFGLAKAMSSGDSIASGSVADSPTITSPAMTRHGAILGTAAYMSPEQAKGRSVDRRSDIWAFGCVVFELLTGRRAFSGESITETLSAVMRDQPDWTTLPPNTPPILRTLLLRCLEKDARQRLRDIGEARVLLSDRSSMSNAGGGSRTRRSWVIAAAVTAGVLTGGTSTAMLMRSRPVSAPARRQFTLPLPPGITVTGGSHVSLSADGRYLAIGASPRGHDTQVWIYDLQTGGWRAIDGTESVWRFALSPDGSKVAFLSKGALKTVTISGGAIDALVPVADDAENAVDWGADDWLVFGDAQGGGLKMIPARGGSVIDLTKPDASRNELNHTLPSFDGHGNVLFTIARKDGTTRLGRVRLSDRRAEDLGDIEVDAQSAGDLVILARQAKLMAAAINDNGLTSGQLIASGFTEYRNGHEFAVSDSVIAFIAKPQDSRVLSWVERNGHESGRVDVVGLPFWTSIAPDNRRFTLDTFIPETGAREVWVVDGGRRERVTDSRTSDSDAVWSPDGKQIAYSADSGKQLRLFSLASASTKVLAGDTRVNGFYPTDWSRDGRFIAFATYGTGTTEDLWMLPIDGGQPPQPLANTKASEGQGRFSPDGRFVAFKSDETGRGEVYLQELPPGKMRRLASTDGGAQPMWRADGKELFYIAADNTMMAVGVTLAPKVDIGTPRALFKVLIDESTTHSVRNHYSVTSDGQRFLINTVRGGPQLTVILNWRSALTKAN